MRKTTIHLGEKILLDVPRLWRTGLALIGNSGSGKTVAGRELIEETYTYGSQVIIDLMKGELATLREEFDYLLIGPNGDLPADPAIAADLARFVRDTPCRVIVDLSRVDEEKKQLFVERFGETLLALPESKWDIPLLVFMDEVHIVAPQEERPRSRKTVGKLSTLGRAQRICLAFTTQRLAEVSKTLLSSINNRCYGRFIEPVDMKVAASVLGLTRKDWPMMQQLEEGWFHCMGPAFSTKGVFLARTSGKTKSRHIDRSAGDTVKKIAASPRVATLAKTLIEKQAALAAKEQREKDEIVALKARIKELEGGELRKHLLRIKQLETEVAAAAKMATSAPRTSPPTPRERVVTVADPVAVEAAHARGIAEGRLELARELGTDYAQIVEGMRHLERHLQVASKTKVPKAPPPSKRAATEHAPAKRDKPSGDKPSGNGSIGRGAAYDVLVACLMYDGPISRRRAAFLAGLNPAKSTMRGALAELSRAGYISREGDDLEATASARRDYPDVKRLPTGPALIAYWKKRIGNASAQGRLFEVLADADGPLTEEEASSRAGLDPSSSTYRGAKAPLRKLGVLESFGKKIGLPVELRE